MTARERRRQRLATALRQVEHTVAGKYQRQDRQEWAASRRAEGWSERTVRDAVRGLDGLQSGVMTGKNGSSARR